jgi:GR25 family glycosyltransferase involved in LPS biosynthesis
MKMSIIVFFIIIFLLFVWYLVYPYNVENFEMDKKLDFYVITMKNPDRLKNIEEQEGKINKNVTEKIKIELIDAVVGVDLDLKNMVNEGILSPEFVDKNNIDDTSKHRRRVIGCYASHLKNYDIIKRKGNNGYSVIFEDDFDIKNEDFLDVVIKALNDLQNHDFDMLFLGNNHRNYGNGEVLKNKGDLLVNNIHFVNGGQYFYGTHAILINNKNISKIIDKTKFIHSEIDTKLQSLSGGELKILVLYPDIVEQQPDKFLPTTIQFEGMSLFKSQLFS